MAKGQEMVKAEEAGALAEVGEYTAEAAEEESKKMKEDGGAEFMKLVPGKNVVRILPPMKGMASPFVTVYQHYIKLPGATSPVVFVCPRMTKKLPCPACAQADKLRHSGNPADVEYAQDLFARRRVFCNVVDRKAPEKGVQVLAFGKSIHQQLSDLRADQDAGGDYTHPTNGFDIVIQRTGSGKNDTEYKVMAARTQSPLGDLTWLKAHHDLARYAILKSPEEIMELLSGTASAVTGGRIAKQPKPATAADAIDGDPDDGDENPFG